MKRRTKVREQEFLQTGKHSAGRKLMGLLLCVCLMAASMPMEYLGISVQAAEEAESPDVSGRSEETGNLNLSGQPEEVGNPDLSGRSEEAGNLNLSGRSEEAGNLNLSGRSEEADNEEGKKLQAEEAKPEKNSVQTGGAEGEEESRPGDGVEGEEESRPENGTEGEKEFRPGDGTEGEEESGSVEIYETAGEKNSLAEDQAKDQAPPVRAEAQPGIIQEDTVWTACTLGSGNVYVNPGVTLTIEGQISISGTVMFQGGGQVIRGSADAYFDVGNGDELTFVNITLDGNGIPSAYSLIDVKENGIVDLDDRCVIRNCVKDNKDADAAIGGAAVCLNGGTLGCNDVLIENCRANHFGGAICARNRSSVMIAKGTYQNNRTTLPAEERYAEWGGGFIYALRSSITIYGGRFLNNSATGGGGCILQTGSAGEDLVLYGGYFQGNTSSFPGYEGSGGLWCSSEQVQAGRLSIKGDVNFVGNGTYAGMDGIYLDMQEAFSRTIQLDSELQNPVMVYLEAVEEYVIAKGNGYTLTQQDAEKIIAVDTGNSGKQWYSVWNQGENEIYLSETNPGYGGSRLVQADFYSGRAGQKETQTAIAPGPTAGGKVYAPRLEPMEGFLPVGWEEDPYGFDGGIPEGAQITITEDKAYYGIYEKEVMLDFFADGKNIPNMQTGTCRAKVREEEISYQYPQFLIPQGPNRPGDTFLGWNTKEDGTGRFYYPGSQEALEESAVLYAIWEGGELGADTPGEAPEKPGMARYRVEYYKQEPDGRNYRTEEGDTYYGTDLVNAVVKAQAKQFPGFTENISHPSRIAEGKVRADGTLVLKLYYDQNSYAIHFDLNGGQGDVPKAQTVRGGSLLPEGEAPVRAGYNFKGWYLDKAGTGESQWDFGRPPEDHGISGSTVLYAKWADETAPVFGKATVTFGYKGLFHWIAQKKGLTVTVPVKEEGSGIRQAKYTIIRKDGSTEEVPVRIRMEQGRQVVQFTLDEDFYGTIVLTCTDYAGNTSASKVLVIDGNGGVTENNGPEISASTVGGGLSNGVSTVEVKVRDEENGISKVTYSVDGQREMTADLKEDGGGDGKDQYFMAEISGGGMHILQVTATDRDGYTTIRQFKVEIGGPGALGSGGGTPGGSGNGSPGSGNGGISGSGFGGGTGSGGSMTGGSGSGNFGNGGPGGSAGSGGSMTGGPGGGSGSGTPGGGSGSSTPGGSGGNTPGSGTPGSGTPGTPGGNTPGSGIPGGGEPGTGEFTQVEIYATVSMIAGFTYLLLYAAPCAGNMTEAQKELMVHRLIRWAEGKGGLRRLLALAAIFLLLAYYHSIGKSVGEEWKAAALKR